MSTMQEQRLRRKQRIRAKISGTTEKPRLTVFKSNMAIYAQLIDDVAGKTLAAASSLKDKKANVATAQKVGKELAEKAKTLKISTCVFDRNGYQYQGTIKSIADAAREGGLQF